MAANDVRKYVNLFIDGKGLAGQLEEFTAPKLTERQEEFRAGGMDMAVEIGMGLEKLEASFSLIAYSADVIARFGMVAGNSLPFVAREALESMNGLVTPVVHTMRGKIKELDPGVSKAGDKPSLKGTLALTYYKLEHGGKVLHEIDAERMIRIVNGVDQLAAQRAAIGV